MNDQRRDQGGLIVVGCLLVGLLSVCLLGGSASLIWVRMVAVGIEVQQATRAEQEAREAQAAARSAEEQAASRRDTVSWQDTAQPANTAQPESTAQPQTAKSTDN